MRRARPRPETECVAADAIGSHPYRCPITPASCPIHNVKQRDAQLRSRRALLHPGSLSSLSLLYRRMGGAATPIAGTCGHRVRWISRTPLNPSHEFVSFVSSSRDIRARVLFAFPSFSASDPRARGWRSAGRRYPLSCRARNNATPRLPEAWAVPRNRDGASRRSTVTVLGPLRARLRVASGSLARATLAAGIASGLPRVPNLPATVLRAAWDATSRSAFRNRF